MTGHREARQRPGVSRQNTSNIEREERRPLLSRARFAHSMDGEQFFSCNTNAHAHLPVYTNIHRIRRDVVSIVEDYLTIEQLRDLRLNISVVRPLVDKLYELDDISIVYCLLVNRAQFLHEQQHLNNRQNVYVSRATLCEVVATRILRRFGEDNPGPDGLLLLANILVAGFEPFQNAPGGGPSTSCCVGIMGAPTDIAGSGDCHSQRKQIWGDAKQDHSTDAIYTGHIIYTPSTFLDIIPDRYKQKPISLYDPREAPLLNQYRLIVPRTRNILELFHFIFLLFLYLLFMAERNAEYFSWYEITFAVYAFGWVLDQFATILEHGWGVYTQNLWSFLDVMFAIVYWAYLIMRLHGWRQGEFDHGQQALDVLAMGAPFLVPRLAFNLLSDNLVFLSLRSMMANFILLTFLACWCFLGFLLSMVWLAEGRHRLLTISKWMLWIWFGLDGTGVQRSTEFHWLLGPTLMITFAFLGNTLFLTILVSMLSNTFSTIVANATAEIQFRRAVLTLEGVKADAIFAYPPPFNILAMFVLLPMKFLVNARWFHKIHVATVRAINLPILLLVAIAERRLLWPESKKARAATRGWFWERWRITTHGDIQTVFAIAPPDSVEDDIAVDDELTHHMIRRQYIRQQSTAAPDAFPKFPPGDDDKKSEGSRRTSVLKPPTRRDSIAPFGELDQQVRDIINESGEVNQVNDRLSSLEQTTARMEAMLEELCASALGDDDGSFEGGSMKTSGVTTGTLRDPDRTERDEVDD
ncbi:receptor-activated Ca2+-permeable cation channel [Apiospora phragmitis]|uniref:Receptor-activated Ca2+-permeable cation channel n=1 Tax=Apiospora phragmitis TaxID=2905665 RepID=A0ABR1TUT6_9PEZI